MSRQTPYGSRFRLWLESTAFQYAQAAIVALTLLWSLVAVLTLLTATEVSDISPTLLAIVWSALSFALFLLFDWLR
ncbi:hypothetical protein RYH80_06585 [Halobaculum sp. MBLA0147]|uniref:hypothetical protein n=1 Tax=Halobaculum sp. MBLA0147 TaxID=3079934 RepID=UPI0035232361